MEEKSHLEEGHEEHKEERCWSDLPQDLLCFLLYYLSPKGKCAFRATCKSWNAAEISLPPPVGSPSSLFYSSPSFMFTHSNNSRHKLYHPIFNKFYNVHMPELKGAVVHCSNYGWLLMSRPDISLLFFNPFTKQKIELPPTEISFNAMSFTSPPTSSDCQILGLSNRHWKTGIIKRGDTWRLSRYNSQNMKFGPSTHSPVFYNGSFYFLNNVGNVGVCSNGKPRWVVHQTKLFKTGRDKKPKRQSFLLEVNGKLLGIFNPDDESILIKWLDTENWEWREVENLEDKILYVSHSASFARCDATKEAMGNRVYFPKFYDNVGVFYSLDTKKYHSVAGNFSSTTSYNLDEVIEYGTWNEPNLDVLPEEQLEW